MKRTFVFFSVGALVATLSAPAAAQVNCGIVNKQLQMGRSVEDVAQNLVISEDEVKKCQSAGGGAAGAPPSGAAGSPPTGAAGSAPTGAAGSSPSGAAGAPPSGQ